MFNYANHWWPDGIKPTAPPHALKRRDRAFAAMQPYFPHPTQTQLCVTAGGMTGLWALEYLQHGFERVITFEPAPHVWPCLERNCAREIKLGLIEAHNKALGAAPGVLGIVVNSLGSSFIEHDASPALALTSVVTLDSLALPRLDYLQLDLEGYEYPALRGAWRTIERFRPVVQLEDNGLAATRDYDWGPNAARNLLASFGYRERARIPGSDVIYTR